MKEISTIRKPTTIKQLHPSQVSCSEILFGRAIGRVKVPDSKRQHGFEDNKEIAPKFIPDQPRIKLVRLMFYLPTICKESDASFSIEVCKFFVYVSVPFYTALQPDDIHFVDISGGFPYILRENGERRCFERYHLSMERFRSAR